MNNKSTISDVDIWAKRKDTLVAFIQKAERAVNKEIKAIKKAEKKRDENDFLSEEEIVKLESMLEQLKIGPEKVVAPDSLLWLAFIPTYEQRQRISCQSLLQRLIEFTEKAAVFLQPSYGREEGYSPRYLWRVLLNEASTDLQILQAAVQQRRNNQDGEKTSTKDTLFKADIISEQTMAQAIDSGFLKQTQIITYFKEDVTIRSVPYADVVLISIAYASMEEGFGEANDEGISYPKVSRDLLAIPHEVGHHLFWKGQMPGKQQTVHKHLQRRLRQAQIWEWDWRSEWLEEIFADAFGCLVAGPVMALSFQDLLTDNPPVHFREDTGHHPIPILRPFIQTKILRGITDADGNPLYNSIPNRLDEHWKKWLAANFGQEWDNVDPLQMEYKLHSVNHPVKGQRILEALDEIIAIVLGTLRAQPLPYAGDNWTHGGWKAWTKDLQDDEGLVELTNKLTFETLFQFRSHWLREMVTVDQMSTPQNWPDQILAGWSVEGPEDRGQG